MRATVFTISALLTSVVTGATVPHAINHARESTEDQPKDSSSGRPENWLINFGDSYSKTGFQPDGDQPSAENPIGNPPLPGKTSAGGLNWIGHMVTEFNTSFSSDPNSLTLTYNFGRPGGTVNRHPFGSKNPDFEMQMDWFEKYFTNDTKRWTPENAVASVWYGVNDINGIFAKKLDRKNNNGELVRGLLTDYHKGLERLYGFGLRKYVVLTAPPLSMLPLKLKWKENKLTELNACVEIWNALLREKVQTFREDHEDVVITIVDISGPFWEALKNPKAFNSPDTTCRDANGQKCLWFDNSHPAVRIMRLIASNVADVLKTDEYRCWGGVCDGKK